MKKFRNLRADEIECRVARIQYGYITLLLYKDARCDMNILDDTVGAFNWRREHTRENANCIVSIYDSEKHEWISKEDTGTESNTEAQKGLASDSFKRACVNWGIGRELYSAPTISFKGGDLITRDGKCYEKFTVSKIEYDENSNIISLIICHKKTNKVVFEYPSHKSGQNVTANKPNDTKSANTPPKAAECAPPKAAECGTVTKQQAMEIVNLCAEYHIDPEYIKHCYYVDDIRKLPERAHSQIFGNIEQLKRKNDEWKAKQ